MSGKTIKINPELFSMGGISRKNTSRKNSTRVESLVTRNRIAGSSGKTGKVATT